jgi:L-ascorbate metabolism protein UlaG (beta-lactamase superfamily)
MKYKKWCLLALIVGGCAQISVAKFSDSADASAIGRVHSRVPVELPDWRELINITRRYIFESQTEQIPSEPVQVNKLTRTELDALPGDKISAIRIGHSTVLLKIMGDYWLTDPVFSERLGPVYFMGVERLHSMPIAIADLPAIHGVLISHNHYDHLDERTIRALHAKVQHFVVPIGNGQTLVDWGVPAEKISELDWWESKQVGAFTVVSTPANHLSGRRLIDQNEALWSSWVLMNNSQRIYFSGDSGYSGIFKEIGDRFGPFDLTLMENGAYDESWSREHLMPAETVMAHQDLKGIHLMPIHNSTFDLAFHPWHDPLTQVSRYAKEKGVQIVTPRMGQVVTLGLPVREHQLAKSQFWWQPAQL